MGGDKKRLRQRRALNVKHKQNKKTPAATLSTLFGIDGMQCSGVECNGCILVILGHFDTFGRFGSKFGEFLFKKVKK